MKWYDVKDKLPKKSKDDPEHSETVMISDGNEISIGYYEFEYSAEDDEEIEENDGLSYSSATWHDEIGCLEKECDGWPKVRFWAKLPKAPKKIIDS